MISSCTSLLLLTTLQFCHDKAFAQDKYFSIQGPTCIKFNPQTLSGTGEFVGSTPQKRKTGDLSIAAYGNEFTPRTSYPLNTQLFQIFKYEATASCTILEDDPTNPSNAKAPKCDLEIDFEYCPTPNPVPSPTVIKTLPPEFDLCFGQPDCEPRLPLRRNLRQEQNEGESVEEEDFIHKDRDLQNSSSSCKDGKIMATGTGPKNYAITGGTDDFFGAFGQIDAALTVNGSPNSNGDIALLLELELQVCFYNA